MNEIGGAVQRVDDPVQLVGIGLLGGAFFSNETRFGQQGAELRHNQLLTFFVDVRNQVVEALVLHRVEAEFLAFGQQERTCGAGNGVEVGPEVFWKNHAVG